MVWLTVDDVSGGIHANAIRAEVGAQLTAVGAHYGTSRVAVDGTRSVSWWFEASRRRERRLVFRAVRGLEVRDVEYSERSTDARRSWVHDTRTVRTSRAGVVVAVALLVACRSDIDLAPNIAAFAVPLLGVSAVWTLIGLSGAEHRR